MEDVTLKEKKGENHPLVRWLNDWIFLNWLHMSLVYVLLDI